MHQTARKLMTSRPAKVIAVLGTAAIVTGGIASVAQANEVELGYRMYAGAIKNPGTWRDDPTLWAAEPGFTEYHMPGTMKETVEAPQGYELGDPDYLTFRVIDAKDPVPIQRYEWNGGRTDTPPAPPTDGNLGQWNPSTTNWNPNRGEVMGEVAQRAQGNNASWYYWSTTPAVQAVDVDFVRWQLVEEDQAVYQDGWCEAHCYWCEVCVANPLPQFGYVRQNWRASEGRPDGGEAPGFDHPGWHSLQERTFTQEQPTEVGVPFQEGGGNLDNRSWFRWVRVDTGGSRNPSDWQILTEAG